ncbi:L-ascorbate oxidase homolog [Wolffia australiana]
MKANVVLLLFCGALICFGFSVVIAEDPYRFFTWTVTYGTASPLGVPQQVILINGQFPGPQLDCVTNDNIIVNVINKLDEPFLITWNGIKQRKNSWQDGVLGTNCPIPPNSNFTYKWQAKDQIGSYSYFPSTAMHRASGGFGAININQRAPIAIPYPIPSGEFTLLVGDWYKAGHKAIRQSLDAGRALPPPDGILMNGRPQGAVFTGERGKTYKFRVTNVGLSTSFNFRIQGHKLKAVEVEGAHVIQQNYDSIDVHVGQSIAVLVTLDQPAGAFYVAASTRFSTAAFTATAVLQYAGSSTAVLGSIPPPPAFQLDGSLLQARSFRWNLTANAARPNPQGSYKYGSVPITRTLVLANSAPIVNGRQRYAVNGFTYVVPDTPLKLADYFNIPGVFTADQLPVAPPASTATIFATSVLKFNLRDFVEIVFQNNEKEMQSWHIDGIDFWVVAYDSGEWNPSLRKSYNLVDATTRHTVQVFPNGWSAILVALENQGMWNVRSSIWARQYLGQQFYIRVWTPQQSLNNEYDIPPNALLCGRAKRS